MFSISRRVAVPAAVFALAASTSVGVSVAAAGTQPQASTTATGCTATAAAPMNHAMWVLARTYVHRHYAGQARAREWRRLTSHPAAGRNLATRLLAASRTAACTNGRRQRHPVTTPATTTTVTPPTTSSTTTPSTPTPPSTTSTTTVTPPVVNALAPSGQAMPVGDVPGLHQVFADDFTKTVPLGSFPAAVSSTWGNSYPDGWTDTSGAGTYMPSKVISVANGVMNMYLHTVNGVHMVAAPVPTLPTMTYGRYVIRFKSDSIPGFKTAWLLWPDSEVWPRDGEVDFPEGSLNGTISGYVHHQGAISGSDQYAVDTPTTYTGWHTAQIDWLPTGVTFSLDGNVVGATTTRVPNTPMHWVIQTETDYGAPPAAAAGNVQIDWVTAYTRT
jgi:hypothetical protein